MTDDLKSMIYSNDTENNASNEEVMSTEKVVDPIEIVVTPSNDEPISENVMENVISIEFNNINFYDWFCKYSTTFQNIRHVKMSCRGLNTIDTMAFLIPHPNGGVISEKVLVDDVESIVEYPRQKLIVKEEADIHLIPDLQPSELQFFNNDNFICHWDFPEAVQLSVYFRKKQAFYVFQKRIADLLIPYSIKKYDIRLKGFSSIHCPIDNIMSTLQQELTASQKESAIIMYSQISKVIGGFNRVADIVRWLLERKSKVSDIHHLLVIDHMIMNIINLND